MCYTNKLKKTVRERRDAMATYKTAGRKRLLAFLETNPDKQFTVEELCGELDTLTAGENKTRKSTLYRHLSELCGEGTVRKYRSDTQSAYVYQYVGGGDCARHFHLKCVACGVLTHLECTVSEELLSHISSHHGFSVDSGRSILYGLCEACASLKRKNHPTTPRGCSCGHHH